MELPAANRDTGVSLLAKACDGQSAHGCSHLGEVYRDGRGVDRSDDRAASLFMLACQGQHAVGCRHLSAMIANGHVLAGALGRYARIHSGDGTPVADPRIQRTLDALIRGCAKGDDKACGAIPEPMTPSDPGF